MKNLYTLFFLILFSTSINAQWTSMGDFIVPFGNRVWSMKIAPDNSMWALSEVDTWPIPAHESPQIHTSSDGGLTWNTFMLEAAPGASVYDIAPIDKNTAFVNTMSGIFKTENGGENWQIYNDLPDATRGFYSHFWNKDDGMLVWDDSISTGSIALTDDGGTSWTQLNPFDSLPLPAGLSFPPFDSTEFIGSVWYSTISMYDVNKNMIIIPTSTGNYYLSKDKGYNWTKHPTPFHGTDRAITAIAFFDENTIMVSGDFDRELGSGTQTVAYATNDGGVTWTRSLPTPVSAALHRVPGTQQSFILNGHNNFSWGHFGTFITHDLGATWERLDFTRTLAVHINDDDIGIGACCNNSWFGAEGQIFKWENPLSNVSEKSAHLRVALTPNPTVDFINISIENPLLLRSGSVDIFDTSGQLVFTKRLEDSTGKIDVKNLMPGFYFFNLRTEEGTYFSKFVKN